MFVQLDSAKGIVRVDGTERPSDTSGVYYFNTSYLEGVVEDWNGQYAKLNPCHGASFLVKKEEWLQLKKRIEAEQRKR